MADATENGHVNARRTWIIVIGLILAVVVLAAFVSLHRSQVAIRIGRADRHTITESIATNGKIEALNNFEAYAPMATTVKKINVQQGSWVKPGQLLLQLEDANARLQAARAEAQLKGAEADINAVENGGTKEELLTTRNALVKAQAERDVAQQKLGGRYSKQEIGHVEAQQTEGRASLAAAQQLLKNSNIVAPRAGMVYSLPVRQGAFVNAGDLLVQVADLHKVRVRAFVDEPEIGKLQKGQLVEATWDAVPGRVWQGTVDALPTTVVQHGTRMVGEVTCVVENGDLTLLPNTNISVAVVIARQQDALTVPREAVHQDASGQFVFQVINGELQRRDVKTSVANLTRIQVTSGLTDNAVLALGAINMQSLRAGMPVKIANP